MKSTLILFLLGLSLTCSVVAAQTSSATPPAPPPPPPPSMHPPMMLTADERAEMEKAHDVAFQSDPSLNADVQAIQEKVQALQNKIKAAMIKADPKTAAIFAKLEAGQPSPPPSSAK